MPHCHRYAEKPSAKKQPKKTSKFIPKRVFVWDRQDYPPNGTKKLTFFSQLRFTRMPVVLTKIFIRILHPATLSDISTQELQKAREGLLNAVLSLNVEGKILRIQPLHLLTPQKQGLAYGDNLTPPFTPFEILIHPKEVVTVELSWDKKMPFSTKLGCFAIEVLIETETREQKGK